MIRGDMMMNNNLNINLVQWFHSIASTTSRNRYRESFPYQTIKIKPKLLQRWWRRWWWWRWWWWWWRWCPARWRWRWRRFPPPGGNFPGGFLPAGELFSLWCSPPRRGGCNSSRGTLCGLGLRDEGFGEEKEAKRVVGPPEHRVARPGPGPRRPMVWAHPGSTWLLLLASFVILKNRIFGIISFQSWSSEILRSDGAFSSRILAPVLDPPMMMKHAK